MVSLLLGLLSGDCVYPEQVSKLSLGSRTACVSPRQPADAMSPLAVSPSAAACQRCCRFRMLHTGQLSAEQVITATLSAVIYEKLKDALTHSSRGTCCWLKIILSFHQICFLFLQLSHAITPITMKKRKDRRKKDERIEKCCKVLSSLKTK